MAYQRKQQRRVVVPWRVLPYLIPKCENWKEVEMRGEICVIMMLCRLDLYYKVGLSRVALCNKRIGYEGGEWDSDEKSRFGGFVGSRWGWMQQRSSTWERFFEIQISKLSRLVILSFVKNLLLEKPKPSLFVC